MQHRIYEKTGEEISLLGLGTMRMPIHADGKLNHEASIEMIRYAIDNGVNYVDTAYMYHDGESEVAVGKALKDGYREKIILADKMPVWLAKDEKEMADIFEEQFSRLEVDSIDFYLVHNITAPIWKRAKRFGIIEFLEKQKKAGRIREIGFSFHDEYPVFKEVLDAYNWDVCKGASMIRRIR